MKRPIQPRARSGLTLLLLGALACGGPAPVDNSGPTADWPEYGGDLGGLRYSPLTQITPDNVGDLEVAWIHRHGDVSDGSDGDTRTSFNATPIVAGGSLFLCTGTHRILALDPETGEERWSFDPQTRLRKLRGPYPRTCRRVAWWQDPNPGPSTHCRRRIFPATIDSELVAVDADTGKACRDFGRGGRVDLRQGIDDAPAWEYYVTSPPIVVRGRVVVGALVSDNLRVDAPAGVVRAFDARTGALAWAWDPVPPGWPAPPEGTYTPGTPNVWSILSGDEERGLVFVPTGNAAPDYFSAVRQGLDHYASSVVALDAETGRVHWFFQTVHRDVWDYDVASQPTLFQIPGVGGGAPAVAQPTKMGHLFLLHRETGEPLYPVEERPVPQGAVAGESLSPTQPFPTHPETLHPAVLTPQDAWGFTPWDRAKCAQIIAGYRSDGIFTPPSLSGSILYPGSAGGANWGSASLDPERGVLFVNQSRLPMVLTMLSREDYDALPSKEAAYPEELYPGRGAPYALRRGPLLSPLGAPCNPPPWGTLTAVDLASGQVLWESTLGSTRDQAPFPLWLDLGSPNLGGSIATASGLVFIGATTDKFLRAFDARSGDEIWSARLPYTANATPVTYRLRPDGRQFVVIAAGGHGWSEPGDAVVAFTLP